MSYPYFVGRLAELNSISKWLAKCRKYEKHRPLLITGLGGIGKSSLVLKFLEKCVLNENSQNQKLNVVWLHGEKNKLLDSISKFLKKTSTQGNKDKVDIANKKCLEKRICQISKENETLLIIDNLVQMDYRLYFICTSIRNLSVLVTSRDSFVMDSSASRLNLSEIPRTDAENLFELQLNTENPVEKENIQLICTRLQNFPLGVIQAANYIGNKMKQINSRYHMEQFDREFSCVKTQTTILENIPYEISHFNILPTLFLWDSTLEQFGDLNSVTNKSAMVALILLKLLSYGKQDAIKESLLLRMSSMHLIRQDRIWNIPIPEDVLTTINKNDIQDALYLLCRFHFLVLDPNKSDIEDQYYKISKLLQTVTRLKSPESWIPPNGFINDNGFIANELEWVRKVTLLYTKF